MTRRIPQTALLLSLLTLATACGGEGSSRYASAQPISLAELDGSLAAGPMLVEIELLPGTLDAREIHSEIGEDDEKIESTVASIDAAAGTLTLDLGGLVIAYDDSTRFRTESDSDVPRGSWEAAVSAGTFVEIRRDRVAVAQSALDASFSAADLRIADEVDEPTLELVIDQDNLEVTGESTAILHLLGLDIAISSSTELFEGEGSGSDPASDQFEDTVTSVDVPAGTLTLASGTVVDTTGVTFDPEGDLFALQAVADAVAASAPVRAEGRGSAGPNGVVTATSLKVEVDD